LRTIKTMLLILVAVVLCVVGAVAVIDIRCSTDIARWLPLYPNAQIIQEDYNFRRRASGITTMVLHTTDPTNVVFKWYYQQRFTEADKDPNRGLAATNFNVVADRENGGSLIYLYSRCGQ
jgi:hypothetical protein